MGRVEVNPWKAFFFHKGKFSRKLWFCVGFCSLAFLNHALILFAPAYHWTVTTKLDPSIVATLFVSLDALATASLGFYLYGKKTD